ncbi:MAG: hypothetical protein ACPGSB_11290 [Opitutales bacterium]
MAPSDPQAIRSRADLVWINRLMGSERWLLKRLKRLPPEIDTVVELGAGEGHLISMIKRRYPELRCIACDLMPRPKGLDSGIEWISGDIMQNMTSLPLSKNTVLLASLFLHHLEASQLDNLGQATRNVFHVLALEPDRSALSLCLGRSLLPFVGSVTRKDMITSIRAGFQKGELAKHFGRKSMDDYTWLGGRRTLLK